MQYQYSRACSHDSVAAAFNQSVRELGRKFTTTIEPSGAASFNGRARGFGSATVSRYFREVDYKSALRDSLNLNRQLLDHMRESGDDAWVDMLDSNRTVASMLDRQDSYANGDQWTNAQLEHVGLGVWGDNGFMTEYVKPGVKQGREYVEHMERFAR